MKCLRKHHKTAADTLMVFCKNSQLVNFAWNPNEARSSLRRHACVPAYTRPGILLYTGAKAYPRGNGWWHVIGYAPDLSDITPIEKTINEKN